MRIYVEIVSPWIPTSCLPAISAMSLCRLRLTVLFITTAMSSSPIAADDQKSFLPTRLPTNGSMICANDVPSSRVNVDDVLGIPFVVPDAVKCSFYCTGLPSCTSFNVRFQSTWKCETYDFVPRNCSTTSHDVCQHFEVYGRNASCKPVQRTSSQKSATTVRATTTLPTTVTTTTAAGLSLQTKIWTFLNCLGPAAILNDRLFVIYNTETRVSIYNAAAVTSDDLLGHMSIPNLGSAVHGLAASVTNEYLYISDSVNYQVHAVNLQYNIVKSWSVHSMPMGLSVNSANNVLVATNAGGLVQEFSPTGVLVSQVNLPFDSAWHAAELSPGIIAVSSASDNSVYKMSMQGQVIAKYPNSATSNLDVPLDPRMLAVDGSGYILVADYSNDQVIVLDPLLENARVLPLPVINAMRLFTLDNARVLPLLGIKHPLSLTLDQARGLLYVGGDTSTPNVFVYGNIVNLSTLFTG